MQCEAKSYAGIADEHPRQCQLPTGHLGDHQYIAGSALALLDFYEKRCDRCKEVMECEPMRLRDGRVMHPGCWAKVDPTQPLSHSHHETPQADCDACAPGPGPGPGPVVIVEGKKLEPRKGLDMSTRDPRKKWTIEEFIKEYGHDPRKAGDDEHCAICNVTAPRVLGFDPRFYRHGQPMLVVSLNGWMKIFYPWPDPPQEAAMHEHSNVCPRCGKRVAEYVALLKDPGITEHDL